ncbi:hypothetical protein IPL85_04470 [Candidatus Saccharibacteria bacterium]|nr:MAG: hypothetical protein IPL85_04470 [Candidatus Saccharibacteria bacterium]
MTKQPSSTKQTKPPVENWGDTSMPPRETVTDTTVYIIGSAALGSNNINGEINDMKDYLVKEIPPMGFGAKDAKISYTKQKAEKRLSDEVESIAVGIIESGFCMAKITDKDDGCMDGRGAVWATFANAAGKFVKKWTKAGEHLRAKIAGAGYLTALSMKNALDSHVKSVDEEITEVAEKLMGEGVICGTHIGDHQSDELTDCGANDNLEKIFKNGIDYFGNITNVIQKIYTHVGLAYDESAATRVKAGWAGTVEHESYFKGSNGVTRYKRIMDYIATQQKKIGADYPISTSKHLRGGHNEAFVVLNFCEGKSFSQPAFKKQLQELQDQFPNISEAELPQVFVVDVPRIVLLARTMAKGRKDSDRAFDIALFAGVAFQFATAATLTDGSLRTFLVTEKS